VAHPELFFVPVILLASRAMHGVPTAVLALTLALSLTACGSGDSTGSDTTSEANDTPKPAGPELLKRAGVTVGFENGTAGWAGLNQGVVIRSTSKADSGKASLQVKTDDQSGYEGAATLPVKVDANQTYVATAAVRAPRGSTMQISLRELDHEGEEIEGTARAFEGNGEWERVSVERAFGPDGVNARIYVRTAEEPDDIVFYVDGASLRVATHP
jgi:hypothetical protein